MTRIRPSPQSISLRLPLRTLERIKGTIGPREWSALYQQRPQPDEGTFFQRDWLKEWDKKPKELNVYGTSDYAVAEGIAIEHLQMHAPSLDDVFLAKTGRSLEGAGDDEHAAVSPIENLGARA